MSTQGLGASEVNAGVRNEFSEIIEEVLASRRSVTDNTQIDHIHRELILAQPVVRNRMYARLLANDLCDDAMRLFMSEYNLSSVKYFYLRTLRSAMKAHRHPAWLDYIRHIHEEESSPRPHYVLFEDLMQRCGMGMLSEREPSRQYCAAMDRGYTAPLLYAAGYALGMEVEAGYQIAVLQRAFVRRFGEGIKDHIWFEAHLNGQEDEHAEASTNLVAAVVGGPSDLAAVQAGAINVYKDIDGFMTSVMDDIDARGLSRVRLN